MAEATKEKKDVLKELLLTEEDSMAKFKSLIDKAKTILRIDQKSGNIVVSSEYDFSNPEKILLFLIGMYFSKELGICDIEALRITELERLIGIKKTTLSNPLGALFHSGYIGQDKEKRYFVHHYKVESIVNVLHDKYIEKKPKVKSLALKYRRPKIGKKEHKDG